MFWWRAQSAVASSKRLDEDSGAEEWKPLILSPQEADAMLEEWVGCPEIPGRDFMCTLKDWVTIKSHQNQDVKC